MSWLSSVTGQDDRKKASDALKKGQKQAKKDQDRLDTRRNMVFDEIDSRDYNYAQRVEDSARYAEDRAAEVLKRSLESVRGDAIRGGGEGSSELNVRAARATRDVTNPLSAYLMDLKTNAPIQAQRDRMADLIAALQAAGLGQGAQAYFQSAQAYSGLAANNLFSQALGGVMAAYGAGKSGGKPAGGGGGGWGGPGSDASGGSDPGTVSPI